MYMMRMKKKRLYAKKNIFLILAIFQKQALYKLRHSDYYRLKSNIIFTNLI